MFSTAERNRRHKAASEVMNNAGLSAIYLTGTGAPGSDAFGCYRYFVNGRVIFFLASVVLFRDDEPMAVVNNLMGKLNLIRNSFIGDALINQDQLGGVIEILKSHGVESGRVGILSEVIPASWLMRLNEELPNIEFVDVSELLCAVRAVKSEEEVEVQRICAKIADAGYMAVRDTIKPGMYENEIVAEINRAMQRLGAEASITLIASGKSSAEKNGLPALHNYASSNRKIEKGDAVALSIAPCYMGYWTQLESTICV